LPPVKLHCSSMCVCLCFYSMPFIWLIRCF
jgi:hypothetical protein